MNTYNDNKNFLYENRLVSPNEIFELDGKLEEEEYTRLFNFYKNNLKHLEMKYGCSPSYFYIRNEDKINAKARKRNQYYIVGINYKVLEILFNKYKVYFEVTKIEGLNNYQELQDILTNHLHDLLYNAILHYNFYHEWAHLLQFKSEDNKEISFYEQSEIYDEESHIAEIDADCVSAYSCGAHLYQYLENHTTQIPSREQTEIFLSLAIAGISIYITEFLPEIDTFYLNKRKYPHPSIRIHNLSKELTAYFLQLQKKKGIRLDCQIRTSKVIEEFRRASKLLSKHFGIDAKYNRVEELIDSNLKDINKYISDILEKIDSNPNSAINVRNNCI